VIWLNKSFSQHLGITPVEFTAASEEEEIIQIKDNQTEEETGHFGPQRIT
jgi:hypothetical protein